MPYSKDARYYHKRQKQPELFEKESFVTIPFSHVKYSGDKFKEWHYQGTPALAIVGTLKTGKRGALQAILIPKDTKLGAIRKGYKIKEKSRIQWPEEVSEKLPGFSRKSTYERRGEADPLYGSKR